MVSGFPDGFSANWLRSNKERVLEGLKINGAEDKHTKLVKWWISDVDPL